MALDALFTILARIGEYMVAPIGRRIGYIVHYNRNLEDLKHQVTKLGNERHRLQSSVDAATRNGEIIEHEVETWLSAADKTMEEVIKLLETEVQGNRRCLKFWSADHWPHYWEGKKVKKLSQVVIGLCGDGKFTTVSHAAPPPENIFSVNQSYEAFESRISLIEQIIEALKDDNINIIGIYGMAGVGKTILVKEVARQAKDRKVFDNVVMATISQTPNLKDIQGEISDMLGLKFVAESVLGRAGRLHERLLKEKRVLVILDDVWARLDLEKVGIPFGCDHESCKIIVTSRSLDTCIEMDSEKHFFVDVLPEREEWALFKKMAGNSTDSSEINSVAVEIARECAGLPIAIVTVARALKNRSMFVWKDALQQLKKSIPININGMHSKVFCSLELSYNYLESEEVRTSFLLCCLFPEDSNIAIQKLLEYGWGLGLFQNVDTMEEGRVRVHTIAQTLKSSCLLLEGANKDSVKMHDVVRDVALSIASKDKHVFLVRVGEHLKRWPRKDVCEQSTAISIRSDDVHEFPDGLLCPKLQTLLLDCSYPFLKIPSTFFSGMKDLRILEFSYMNLLSLPPSMCSLKNLRTLRLDHCELSELSVIKELTTLEILSFCGSDIKELPAEIRHLTHLRLLDLTGCKNLKVIPPDIISSLFELEELYVLETFEQWDVIREDHDKESQKRASMIELKSLLRMTALEIHIPNLALFPKSFFFRNLLRFKISAGSCFDKRKWFLHSKTLKIGNSTGAVLEYGIKVLFNEVEDLHLYKFKHLVEVLYDLNRNGFLVLKCLQIEDCNDLKYLINTVEWAPPNVFPALELLKITDVHNMKELSYGNLPMQSFSNLKKLLLARLPSLLTLWQGCDNLYLRNLRIIRVKNCSRLKHLFSPALAKGLNQLHVLDIAFCETMKEIIAKENEGQEGADDKIVFPQLRFLKLQYLCELMTFWPEEVNLGWKNSLTTPTQQSLFTHKVSFPSLEELQIRSLINLEQIWCSKLLPESFGKLKALRVTCCDQLLSAVHHNFVTNLSNLEELYVGHCGSLRGVFDLQGLTFQAEQDLPLFSLKKLKLQSLPTLMHVWGRNPIGTLGVGNLNSFEIHKCDDLRNLLTASIVKGLVNLQFLCIDSCELMREVVYVEGEADSVDEIVFSKLKHLKVSRLPSLTSFYSGCSTLRCPCLEEFSLMNCPKMENFINGLSSTERAMINERKSGTIREMNFEENSIPESVFNEKVSFPNIKKLKIEGLQNMGIWHSQLQAESFCKLKVLLVDQNDRLRKLFPSSYSGRLQNLEQLTVSRCNSLEELFEFINERTPVLPQLKQLRLWGLPKLKLGTIHEGLPQVGEPSIPSRSLFGGSGKISCPHLEVLRIEGFQDLNDIWRGKVQDNAFCHLRYLAIRDCQKLQYIFPSKLLKKLYNLRKLVVENCGSLQEIVAEIPGEEAVDKLVFPQLAGLEFVCLPNLKCFCSSRFPLECPSLSRVKVEDCPKMQTFSCGVLSTPMLQKILVREDYELWKGDFNNTLRHLFESAKVGGGGDGVQDMPNLPTSSIPKRKRRGRAEKKPR